MNEQLLKKISEIVIESAVMQKPIEYNQISIKLGGILPPIRLNEPLGEISYRCIKMGFPPLSAIVVNQSTNLPGMGFFTWVASKMGYPNLKEAEWEEFYEQQKENVFNCKNWDVFLENVFGNEKDIKSKKGQIDINNLLNLKEYLFGKITNYYILTIKDFLDTQQNGPYRYHVVLLEKNKLIQKYTIEDNINKQLLTPAKRRGIQLLFEKVPNVSFENVTMVHYKPDRKNMKKLWEKESEKSLEKFISEMNIKILNDKIEKDIDAEDSQEDNYYKDGKVIEYFGTRYERNPINRVKAIEIHGVTCKACGFNFEKTYGERGKDFIEIHHIKPLSTVGNQIRIDPEKDLIPVCSNCHRMIHREKDNILTVEEVKAILVSTTIV